METLINNLGVKGQRTSITIKIINGEVTNKAVVVKRLRVSSGNGDSHDWLELPDTYTKKYLPVGKEDVATPSKLKQWKHLESVFGEIGQKEGISVGLLIGANYAKELNQLALYQVKMMNHMRLRPNLTGALCILLMVLAERKNAAIG